MIRAPYGRSWRAGTWLGVASAILLGALLSARPAEAAQAAPSVEVARQRALTEAAVSAAQRLLSLESSLEPARAAARDGAALAVSGDRDASPLLLEAARLLDEAADEADAAAAALAGLRGMAASARPGLEVPAVPGSGELAGIAGQLREAAEAAPPVVERRLTARRTLERLEAAVAALDEDEPRAALRPLREARQALEQVRDWEPAPVTLPLWLRTTARLIAAAEDIARAALRGDAEAAEAAGRRYARAADEARRADVSLALTLSEMGSGLTSTPLRRLADALAATLAARQRVASLVQGAR